MPLTTISCCLGIINVGSHLHNCHINIQSMVYGLLITYLKRGISVVTIPTSNSDGLKSADNTDDKQLMAVCRDRK